MSIPIDLAGLILVSTSDPYHDPHLYVRTNNIGSSRTTQRTLFISRWKGGDKITAQPHVPQANLLQAIMTSCWLLSILSPTWQSYMG